MCDLPATHQYGILLLAQLLILLFERWLGKTDKVKAGSTLELITNGLGVLFKIIFKRG